MRPTLKQHIAIPNGLAVSFHFQHTYSTWRASQTETVAMNINQTETIAMNIKQIENVAINIKQTETVAII